MSLTKKRWVPPSGLSADGLRIVQSLQQYLLSLEAKGSLGITEATIDSTPIGSSSASSGAFTTLSATGASSLPGLTTVGTLTSGSIASGFGTILTTNQITGGTLRVTTNHARFEGGDVAASGATGIGHELFDDGTNAIHQSFNRTAPAFSPLIVKGTKVTLTATGGGDVVVDTAGRLYGTVLHNNASSPTGTTNQYIASGTYTPGRTNTTNITSSAANGTAKWIRVGNNVSVFGSVSVRPAAAGAVVLDLALPIASTLSADSNLGGSGAFAAGTGYRPVYIIGDAGANRARLVFDAAADPGANTLLTFAFGYEVL